MARRNFWSIVSAFLLLAVMRGACLKCHECSTVEACKSPSETTCHQGILNCKRTVQATGCITAEGVQTCYCSTDLCDYSGSESAFLVAARRWQVVSLRILLAAAGLKWVVY